MGMTSIHRSRRQLLIATGVYLLFGAGATAGPSIARRLKLKNVHTGETFEGPYRDETGPIPSAVSDLATFLRDFHANKIGPLDLGVLDFLADVLDAVGQTTASVLSAYRTPETNARLRATMFGVAEKSQHLYGRAIDISLDGRLGDAKTAARRMARGGVGWYPRSHFIHLDTGPPRNWEMDGTGLEFLLAGRPHRPLTVAERHKVQRSLARARFNHRPAATTPLPPCQQTEAAGVVVTRGMGCTR
jgi:uncharacterized protein YcbK (DUF882 family)